MSTEKRQTMTWDGPMDQKLLLAIIKHLGEQKINYNEIAPMLSPHCTVRALQEHIKKLRKDGRVAFDETSPTSYENSTTTPTKSTTVTKTPNNSTRKRTTPATTKETKKGKATVEPIMTDDEENDEKPVHPKVAPITPTPRKKSAPTAGKGGEIIKLNEGEPTTDDGSEQNTAANEGNTRKKRKYNDPKAVDDPSHQLIGTAMASQAHAAYMGKSPKV